MMKYIVFFLLMQWEYIFSFVMHDLNVVHVFPILNIHELASLLLSGKRLNMTIINIRRQPICVLLFWAQYHEGHLIIARAKIAQNTPIQFGSAGRTQMVLDYVVLVFFLEQWH